MMRPACLFCSIRLSATNYDIKKRLYISTVVFINTGHRLIHLFIEVHESYPEMVILGIRYLPLVLFAYLLLTP